MYWWFLLVLLKSVNIFSLFDSRYGDKAPCTFLGRLFGIAWVLTGIVIISIVTGSIATELTCVTLGDDVMIYGSKVWRLTQLLLLSCLHSLFVCVFVAFGTTIGELLLSSVTSFTRANFPTELCTTMLNGHLAHNS